MVRLPRNEKQTYRFISRPQVWPSGLTLAMTLTLNFQGQIWNLLYLNQKWSDCHETKSKHIDLNSRPQIWQWVWPWPCTLIFEFSRSYVILTIWWPRSGVRIYQIVTGVTSVVGVPSTHLVFKSINSNCITVNHIETMTLQNESESNIDKIKCILINHEGCWISWRSNYISHILCVRLHQTIE